MRVFLKVTGPQWAHILVHSLKWPMSLVTGTWLSGGTFAWPIYLAMGLGWSTEIVGGILHWRAFNLRPRSGTMTNMDAPCVECGHAKSDHTVTPEYLLECVVCSCKYREERRSESGWGYE